jgi:glycosyltransferase involved in cell wall biosynthesis
VVVPSYRRPDSLRHCLRALAAQTRTPDEVIVIVRVDDDATLSVCRDSAIPGLRVIAVDRPGVVAALNAGTAAARGDVIAITDDDCRPRPNWLECACARLREDRQIGAVGGPDLLHGNESGEYPSDVGTVHWYGKVSGNHQAGKRLQDVTFLKGANMSYRREALGAFDERLRGAGAQVCNDMQVSLDVWRCGYRVVFDPAVCVDHFPAERIGGNDRGARTGASVREQHHNETYVLLSTLPPGKAVMTLLYALLIGYRSAVGLGHLIVRLVSRRGRFQALREYGWVNLGRVEGVLTTLKSRSRTEAVR